MKIKQHIYIWGLGLALLTPSGCSKRFLEQTDTTNISENTLFHKPADGVALINAIYNTFDDDPNSDQFMKKAMWYIANYLSQDFHNWGNDIFWLDYQINVDNGSLKTLWEHFYKGISTANSAFPIIEKMKTENVIDQGLSDRLTGEAYFLRGVFYYYLASTFGGVPLELKTVTDAGLHPRNTQDEVFASVESDMTAAAGLLPWKEDLPASELGRANKGAALGYLGAAQLWLKKYTEAVATYNQITDKYPPANFLMANYVDIHEYNHQNNKESLFEVQYLFPSGGNRSWGHSNDSHWISSFGIPWEIMNDFGYDYADPRLSFSFEPGDLRRTCTVLGPNDVHPSPAIQIKNYPHVIDEFNAGNPIYVGTDGKIINTCGTFAHPWRGRFPTANTNDSTSGYYSVKFWRDPNIVDDNNFMSDQNAIMLRLGEVLVSKAEAQFRSGDQAGAKATLQIIRNRAWGGAASPPDLGPDVLKDIINEYRHEISGEMSLWFDLRRSGEHINYVKDNFGKTIPQGHDLMPIPSTAIASNQTLTQNPGY
jgi:starch-binding outer membrane protein, SusD/RagB family